MEDYHEASAGNHLLVTLSASAHRTVLNLSGISCMDSSGINVLIITHRAAHSADGWLRLAAPGPSPSRLIQLVDLDEVIACRPTIHNPLQP
ncbi:STAS domain-containing protein [Streptomyces sp. SID625]|nr:STAS domain-containing protein [Streptomyces sp. SID625]